MTGCSGMKQALQRLWAAHRTPASRLSRRLTLAATIAVALILCRWRPWDLFERGGFSTDFYDAQAHAFLDGRLDVPPDVAAAEGFLIDGKTYLYYGPLLAIARLPFAVFGHWADGRLSRISIVLAFFVACTLTFHIARRVGAILGGGSPRRYATLVAAVAVSPALSLAGWNSVYDETEMWALALFLGTAVALLGLWEAPCRRTLAVAAALALSTVLTRASVGLGAVAAVAFVGGLLWRSHRRIAIGSLIGAGGALLASIAVNLAKFGTLFDLPADRQLMSLQNPQRAAWFAGNDGSFLSPRFLPTTVVQYLRPDAIRLERLVPFIRFGPRATEYGSYPLESNTPASSLTVSATLLFLLAVAGIVVIIRRRCLPLLALTVAAFVAALPSFLIGFVANRYLTDMLPALIVPAAAAVAVIARPHQVSARTGSRLVALLVVWGLWVNVALATWIQNLKEPGFTEMRYAIDDAVFGGPPPAVIDLVAGAPPPRDGVVAIDGDCLGLYIAEQGAWVALELADGLRRLSGTADAAGDTISINTTEGDISIEFLQGTALASYRPVAGDPIAGAAVAIGTSRVAIDIESDPVTGRLLISIDDRLALFAFAAPALGGATIGNTLVVTEAGDAGTPICHDLQARR
ncbi:MAG: hypothetical protein HY826_11060 [Actinobacteria bacterium]|nr:hypothetical protein [Actinomycetota bacterium]